MDGRHGRPNETLERFFMKQKSVLFSARLPACLLAVAAIAALSLSAQAQSMEPSRSPSQGPYGTLGMSNVTSSEAMGQGVMNLNLRAKFYEQNTTVPGAPDGTQITSVTGGAALGVNSYMDVFVGMNVYNYNGDVAGNNSGFGSLALGAKGTLPAAKGAPLRMGLQMAGIFGTGNNQFNTNRVDGYNYIESRSKGSNDLLVRVTQSLLMTDKANGGTGFNVHLNEGVISSFQASKGVALIAGAGVEFIPISQLILGMEGNYRTLLSDVSVSDPLWVTPSVTWRTPKFVNVTLGVDVSVSPDRDAPQPAALAPWRLFGGLSASLDTQKGRRDRNARNARRDSLERASLEARAARNGGSIDSLARLSDARHTNDSLALVDANRRLQNAMNNLPAAEKEFLNSGVLVLDAVYFETGKTEISLNSQPYIELISKMLTKYPKLQIAVDGHTDNVGELEYNRNLSRERSEVVVKAMLATAPSLQGRLTARGYGYSQPKADNNTVEGREMNRRTELSVINKEALKEYR
jgi:outer membrane protein OmpA-like peptidoglycan-associated protein